MQGYRLSSPTSKPQQFLTKHLFFISSGNSFHFAKCENTPPTPSLRKGVKAVTQQENPSLHLPPASNNRRLPREWRLRNSASCFCCPGGGTRLRTTNRDFFKAPCEEGKLDSSSGHTISIKCCLRFPNATEACQLLRLRNVKAKLFCLDTTIFCGTLGSGIRAPQALRNDQLPS